MKRIAVVFCALLGLAVSTGKSQASWGQLSYSGYQPWWNIFAKRYKCLTPEEERLQKFWHDYYDAMKNFYCALDHIDWVAYYKNHGYQINGGAGCYGPGALRPDQLCSGVRQPDAPVGGSGRCSRWPADWPALCQPRPDGSDGPERLWFRRPWRSRWFRRSWSDADVRGRPSRWFPRHGFWPDGNAWPDARPRRQHPARLAAGHGHRPDVVQLNVGTQGRGSP